MDKVRASADQALTLAQQGTEQAQSRVAEVQAKRTRDALYRDLGDAYYANLRTGGPGAAVTAAIAALDAAPVPPPAAPDLTAPDPATQAAEPEPPTGL